MKLVVVAVAVVVVVNVVEVNNDEVCDSNRIRLKFRCYEEKVKN